MGRYMMRESQILAIIRDRVTEAGDDAAVIPFGATNLILTTDMLHRATDFPAGASARTIGWRAVAVSLSDLAAMGARPLGVVLAHGDPDLTGPFTTGVLDGAIACCTLVGTELVGGDIDRHSELTLVSTALGETANPVRRSGACVDDAVCITGELGRTQAALAMYANGDAASADRLFTFTPRVAWGRALAPYATSMIDISDGLARSLHILARESNVGFAVDSIRIPTVPEFTRVIALGQQRRALLYGGEDYELLFTLPHQRVDDLPRSVRFTVIGKVTASGVLLDEQPLPDTGYEH